MFFAISYINFSSFTTLTTMSHIKFALNDFFKYLAHIIFMIKMYKDLQGFVNNIAFQKLINLMSAFFLNQVLWNIGAWFLCAKLIFILQEFIYKLYININLNYYEYVLQILPLILSQQESYHIHKLWSLGCIHILGLWHAL